MHWLSQYQSTYSAHFILTLYKALIIGKAHLKRNIYKARKKIFMAFLVWDGPEFILNIIHLLRLVLNLSYTDKFYNVSQMANKIYNESLFSVRIEHVPSESPRLTLWEYNRESSHII